MTRSRGRHAVLVAVAVVAALVPTAGPAPADEAVPARSRAYERIDDRAGCGTPAGVRIADGAVGDWPAPAGGVTGTGFHAGGEYVWTDYAYDDAGTGELLYPGEGEFLQPADDGSIGTVPPLLNRYGGSAADVVEARFAADDDRLHVAVVLNFLNAVDTTVLTLGFDTDGDDATGVDEWPFGAGISTPGADVFVTAHPGAGGFCATVTTAAAAVDLDAVGGAAAVDTIDNAIELSIPLGVLGDPAAVEVVAGTGLWDGDGRYKQPIRGSKSPAVPEEIRSGEPDDVRGGQGDDDPGVFNLLFRGDEPMLDLGNGGDAAQASSKRAFEYLNQAEVLLGGTSGPYALDLDLDRIRPGAPAEPVPTSRNGQAEFTRQYRSALDLEGLLWFENDISRDVIYLGSRQPYAVHLPPCLLDDAVPCPPDGVPLVFSFHGGSGSHINQLEDMGPEVAAPMAERAHVLTLAPFGRGRRAPWWRGLGELDVLEAMADVEAAYPVDPDRRLATGGSLGGYASLRFTTLYPDRWAGAGAFCPATYENSTSTREPGNEAPATQQFTVFPLLGSLVNTPLLQVSGTIDPLVRIGNGHRLRDAALAEGLDLRYTEWVNGHHCSWVPETTQRFLDWHVPEMLSMIQRGRAERPAIVHYAADPRQRTPGVESLGVAHLDDIGVRHDAAWWLSDIRLRPDVVEAAAATGTEVAGNTVGGPGDEVVGTVRAVSRALPGWSRSVEGCGDEFGLAGHSGNPEVEQTPGGSSGLVYPDPHHFRCQRQVRSTPDLAPVLDLATVNLAGLTVDVAAAGLDGRFEIRATGDGPLRLLLSGATGPVAGPCVTATAPSGEGLVVDLDLGPGPCIVTVGP